MKAAFAAVLFVFAGLSAPALAQPAHGGHHAAAPQSAEGLGVVQSIDAGALTVTLQHEAIAALGWPARTSTFRVRAADVLQGVSANARVHFELANDNGRPVVTALHVMR